MTDLANDLFSSYSCSLGNTRNATFINYYESQNTDQSQGYRNSQTSSKSQNIHEEQVLRKKRQQMQQLVSKCQQQKNCIKELQEYIQELEGTNQHQERQIQVLRQGKEELGCKLEKVMRTERKTVSPMMEGRDSQMWNTMREQFYLYEGQKRKWQIQQELREEELQLQWKEKTVEVREMRDNYDRKMQQMEREHCREEKRLKDRLRQIEEANILLIKQNLELSKRVDQDEQFKQLMKVRKHIFTIEQSNSKQNMNANVQADVYRRQVEKITEHLKKAKRQNAKLAKIVSNRDSQIEKRGKELEEKKIYIQQIKAEVDLLRVDGERTREDLRRKLQLQESSLSSLRSQFDTLQKEYEGVLRRQKIDRSHWQQVGRLRAQYRKRSNAQLLKIDQIFDVFQFDIQS